MLKLGRRAGQSILVDGKAEIVVLSMKDGVAQLGIFADKKVKVMRKELLQKPPVEKRR